MIEKINIENEEQAKTVLELQRESYKVEAEYIGSDDIPPLKETLVELMSCEENFIGYFEEETLAGAISFKYGEGIVDIHRMVVHPNHFRKGIAKTLISTLETMHPSANKMIVSTGALNIPAVSLYLRQGFEKVEETLFHGHVLVAHFEKNMKRDSH